MKRLHFPLPLRSVTIRHTMAAEPIHKYIVTAHAVVEMSRRGIDDTTLQRVLAAPEQRDTVRPGRDVLQARATIGDKEYLVRVFVDTDRAPANVVTIYRTSKISKYWRTQP